jgi:4-amino-4-deoxy-L-arabinose transferase-like glycosyltransferase
MEKAGTTFLGKRTWIRILVLAILFLGGLIIRLYDITDLPLDFHPTRQLFTAIVARARYYQGLSTVPQWQRDLSAKMVKAEVTDAPVYDGLVALTYKVVGQENLVIPRIYSILFWLIGGIGLYLLARDLTSAEGGLISTAVYLFLPFGIISSRAIQPDPLMTTLIIFCWWSMYRWLQQRSWRWTIIAGVLGGLAILVKALGAFSILGGFLALILVYGIRKSIKDIQFWMMGLIAAFPTLIYMAIGFFVEKNLGSQFSLRFFPKMWISLVFYLQWERMIEEVIGLAIFVVAIIGIFFFSSKQKKYFIMSLWIAYFIYGLVFSYYFSTHNYYHMTLIPIVALSLAALEDYLYQKLRELNPNWMAKVSITAVISVGLFANAWDVRDTLHKTNYRGQDQYWAKIGETLGHDTSVVALTQDYGYRLEYWGWVMPATYWPYVGDTQLRINAGMSQPDFEKQFAEAIQNRQYFLVSDLAELNNQPDLKEKLSKYAIYAQGDGYIIYDLLHPLGG